MGINLDGKLGIATQVFGHRYAQAKTIEDKLRVLRAYIDALNEIYYQTVIGKGLLRELQPPWDEGLRTHKQTAMRDGVSE